MKFNKKPLVSAIIITIIFLAAISASRLGGSQSAAALQVAPMATKLSDAYIGAVPSGQISSSSMTIGPNPDAIGQTIRVDIRIDNVTVGFWSWTLPTITWDTSVMNLTKVQQGPFLSDNTGGDPTTLVGSSQDLWFNYQGFPGTISGGLTECINAGDTSTDVSGVLVTLSFLITGTGNSTIAISGGNLRTSIHDTSGANITCNSLTVNALSNHPISTSTPTPSAASVASPSATSTSISTQSSEATPTSDVTTAVPEFPLWVIIPLLLLPIGVLANLWKKNQLKNY